MTDDTNPPDDRPDATTEFVWPPPDEGNPIEVVEFGSEILPAPVPRKAGRTEDRQPEVNLREVNLRAEPADTWVPPLDPALSQRISTPPERAFERELETDVRPALPAPVEPPPPVRGFLANEPAPVSRNRGRLIAALAVVTALAAAEAVYILRTGTDPDGIVAAEPETLPAGAGGTLEVSSTPAGALVEVDGRDVGVSPLTLADLTPGPHRLVLTAKGRQPVEQQVTIEAGATLRVVAPLPRVASAPPAKPAPPAVAAPAHGTLAIASPLDMEIREDGALLGRTTGAPPTLSPGDHTLHLTDATTGYAVVQRVRITAGRTTRVTVTPPKRPVNINALPWARVTVDGEAVGETPIGALSLSLGPHVLVFRNPTLGERTIAVTVTADGPNLFSVDLRK